MPRQPDPRRKSYDVPAPAALHADAPVGAGQAGRRRAAAEPSRPRLNGHVQRQLGLSLRIFYDGILCGPLPERFVAQAGRLDAAEIRRAAPA